MSLLDALLRQGALRPVDHALAQSLRRLGREDGDTDDRVLVAAALASSAIAHGHAGLDLARPELVCDASAAATSTRSSVSPSSRPNRRRLCANA